MRENDEETGKLSVRVSPPRAQNDALGACAAPRAMALKKIQLKRELRKQRRTSIATGAPMPPALPRRLGSVRGADMAGLTKELPRRFTVGSRAQSELRMAGDGSGYYDDDKKDAAKPDRPPLRLMSAPKCQDSYFTKPRILD